MTDPDHALLDPPVPVRYKLAALWTSVMFVYVYVDIFSFYKPGTVADILDGRVWELDITPGFVLGGLALLSLPSLMVALSLLLPARAARCSNLILGALYIPVSAFNVIGETWSYFYLGAVIEVVLLGLVVRFAWTWPRGR